MKKAGWLAAILILSTGLPAAAQCVGRNLIEDMSREMQAGIKQAVSEVPYHEGILWRATKGDAKITLIGTYHFPDPRHQETIDRLSGTLEDAAALYVEAEPEQEARLSKALAEDPSLISAPASQNLSGRLSESEWLTVLTAMSDRGFPPSRTDQLDPWFIAMMISISPCMLQQTGAEGLDHMLIERAQSADIPVHGLEPWDTLLTLFDGLTPAEEENLIRAALPAAVYADDYAATLAEAYFSGDVWEIWEFGRFDAYERSGLSKQQIDDQFAFAQARLIDRRNKGWIAPLVAGAEAAAESGKSIVAGFGALHLPGEQGVLSLLEYDGWKIEPLE